MIAFLSDDRERYRNGEKTQVARVRGHLRMVPRMRETASKDWLVSDLCSMLARLRRLHARGVEFAQVELSPQIQDAIKSIKMVGNELLVMQPERKGV